MALVHGGDWAEGSVCGDDTRWGSEQRASVTAGTADSGGLDLGRQQLVRVAQGLVHKIQSVIQRL